MSDAIVGMFWNKGEGDLLPYTLERAVNSGVDSIFIADDGSTDNSWEIIESFARKYSNKIEHIQCKPDKNDPAQRQSLLNEIRRRYPAERTWVQILESDIVLLDTNIREVIEKKAVSNLGVSFHMLNAVRKPGEWVGIDTYPNWTMPINELMPWGHWTEVMLYLFRLMPGLTYNPGVWRPWPSGFSRYTSAPLKTNRKELDSPLLSHYGFRGPTHFHLKYKNMGTFHRKYKNWNVSSPKTVLETVPYFNGIWNSDVFEMSREGWKNWLRKRGIYEQRS
jgi:glycosyltransferase involved in cell wall biosynthesis